MESGLAKNGIDEMLKSEKRTTNQKIIGIVAFLFFAISSISKILNLVGIPREASYVLYLAFFLMFFLVHLSHITLKDVLYYLIVLSIASYGLVRYGSYINSDANRLAIIIIFIPAYFFFRFCDEQSMVEGFLKASYINALYSLVYYFFAVRIQSHYSMDYAYTAAVPLCAFFYLFIKEKKLWQLFVSIALFMTIVLAGNRGAMVFPVLCGIYYLFTDDKIEKTRRNKILRYILIALALAVIFGLFRNQIINILSGYSGVSRSIAKLLSGDFLTSVSRDHLYAVCKDYININPWGYGPLASRTFIRGGKWIYPHSLLYELQLDYGKYIGFILFAIFIYMAISNLIQYRKSSLRVVVAVISILGIGSLIISSSYYYEIYLPATIALYFNNHKKLFTFRINRQPLY